MAACPDYEQHSLVKGCPTFVNFPLLLEYRCKGWHPSNNIALGGNLGLPWLLSWQRIHLQYRRLQFDSWRDRLPTPVFLGFPCGSAGQESAHSVGDLGSIPGLGRSPGEGKGSPLQCSGLENSMDCIAHGVTKNQTRLSDFHLTSREVNLRWLATCSGTSLPSHSVCGFPTSRVRLCQRRKPCAFKLQ